MESIRTISFLENNSLKGFVANVKLFQHSEQHDFFTVDIFMTQENMRISVPETGQRISGLVQFQGELV